MTNSRLFKASSPHQEGTGLETVFPMAAIIALARTGLTQGADRQDAHFTASEALGRRSLELREGWEGGALALGDNPPAMPDWNFRRFLARRAALDLYGEIGEAVTVSRFDMEDGGDGIMPSLIYGWCGKLLEAEFQLLHADSYGDFAHDHEDGRA